jgi:hypothetical protein
MSLANDSLLVALGQEGIILTEDNIVLVGITQATAYPFRGQLIRVTTSPANGALQLKSVLTNEAPYMWWAINDSLNTIQVFPFLSASFPEKQGGVNNAALVIPAGQSGYGFKVSQTGRGGGAQNTIDWRSAPIP